MSKTHRSAGTHRKAEIWTGFTVLFLALFALFLVYPLGGLLKESVMTADGHLTAENFLKFFSSSYYTTTILNSVKVTLSVTAVALILGIPFAYFYSFYHIKGRKFLFVVSILCCMSAPLSALIPGSCCWAVAA